MCRFLLQNGADVDHVACKPGFSPGEFPMTTALFQCINDFEEESETMQPYLECRKLLLQAGCDPSWIEFVNERLMLDPLGAVFEGGCLVSTTMT